MNPLGRIYETAALATSCFNRTMISNNQKYCEQYRKFKKTANLVRRYLLNLNVFFDFNNLLIQFETFENNE